MRVPVPGPGGGRRRAPGAPGLAPLLAVALAAPLLAQGNVLVLVADDLGVDMVAAYGEHPDPAHTPVIDQLAAQGVLFRNAWASPTCSPARSLMLTGRHAFRTGVGYPVEIADGFELATSEVALPQALPPGYRSAAVGKWHLASSSGSSLAHPLLLGFEHHWGSMTNFPPGDGDTVWYAYHKAIDLHVNLSTTYATTDTVDDALTLIDGFGADPWFVWVAFNAPHKPYHHPPPALHGYALPGQVAGSEPLFARAAAEAMDTEIGRLLDSIDPAVLADTTVIFLGDNGTAGHATTPPFVPTHAKGTIYEGGLNVPLIVRGPGVAVGECTALVSLVDLYATVVELCGGTSAAEDSTSLVPYLSDPAHAPLVDFVFAEQFAPNGETLGTLRERAARRGDMKLILRYDGLTVAQRELYDLAVDPFEQANLLDAPPLGPEAQDAYDALLAILGGLQLPPWGETWGDLGHGLPGASGRARLDGAGTLAAGDPYTIALTDAPPFASTFLVVGLSYILAPFKAGTMVPAPLVVTPLPTDALGAITLGSTWPAGIPGGTALVLQAWIQDAGGPVGWAASNGLSAVTDP